MIGGRMHYGARRYAGEIGHTSLHLGDYLDLRSLAVRSKSTTGVGGTPGEEATTEPGAAPLLYPRACSCGSDSTFHFEALTNYGGLMALAEAVSAVRLAEVRRLYQADRDHAGGSAKERVRDFDRNGLLSALYCAFSPESLSAPLPSLQGAVDQSGESSLRGYLATVLDHYAFMLSVMTSWLINTLDLQGVVFCGSLIERLSRCESLVRRIDEYLKAQLIGPDVPRLNYSSISHVGWRGAALIGRDPSYRGEAERA